ncbi:MAG: exo-alpha-sialidase [Planctomycetes bacterium]|nr:exo-alpha-sialidase [Planctomycetota bacterium]
MALNPPDARAFQVQPNLLPKLPVQIGVARLPGEYEHRYHHQAQIAWHDGLFFTMWIDHAYREDSPGQIVEYAVSEDGLTWSEPDVLAPVVELAPDSVPVLGVRFSGGFWNREGELFAFSARYDGVDYNAKVIWPNFATEIYAWDGRQWHNSEAEIENFGGFEAPRPLADGSYLACGHDNTGKQIVLIRGGGKSLDRWERTLIPMPADGHFLLEPNFWQDSKGVIHVVIRDESNSHRLYYTASTDGGKSFPAPVRSDIPDARSRVSTGILSDGRPYLCGNSRISEDTANPSEAGSEHCVMGGFGKRIPLTLAIGTDGGRFEKVYAIRSDETSPRWASSQVNNGFGCCYGYQYPNVCEHDGYLYIAHSVNKEDIMVARVAVADL